MKLEKLYTKALAGERIAPDEALTLYEQAPVAELCWIADTLRRRRTDPEVVTWQIDRNVNITNVCLSGCKFCNFHCRPDQPEKAFVTSLEEYDTKIAETLRLGGDQLLLQGGLHPKLDIRYYEELFRTLKSRYPQIRLHALGAPEVAHIARHQPSLLPGDARTAPCGRTRLACPGAGAEILCDEVRRRISPGKPTVAQWCEVMREAHRMNLPTSATMSYIRVKPRPSASNTCSHPRPCRTNASPATTGFIAFIPWIFCSTGTQLEKEGIRSHFSPLEYLPLIATSRIVLWTTSATSRPRG